MAYNFIIPIGIKLDFIHNESIGLVIRSTIDFKLNHFIFIGGFSHYNSNQYFSGGVKLDYRHWSIVYGMLTQEVSALGTPYSIQLILHY